VFPSLPLHVTASGNYGPNAVHSVNALMKELKRTRERGYGVAIEEAESGVSAVAVTISPVKHDVRGVLAVIAPAVRMSEERIEEIAAVARKAADELAMVAATSGATHSDAAGESRRLEVAP
jgi:DNA-binding IclR family transcriptional regulator